MQRNGGNDVSFRQRERSQSGVKNKTKSEKSKVGCNSPSTKQHDAGKQPSVEGNSITFCGNSSPSNPALGSPLPGQLGMPVHVIHPHPHRRHYPHHLLDHFSGDSRHQSSTPVNDKNVVDASAPETRVPGEQSKSGGLSAASLRPRAKNDSPVASSVSKALETSRQQSELKTSKDKTFSNFREPQQWPFFGTESRILPSGRRVSFLRQACLGFSLIATKERELKEKDMHVVCPKAFREPSFGTAPCRSILRSGPKVAELKQRFTTNEKSPTKQPYGQTIVDIDKFTYETMKGPKDSLHAQPGGEGSTEDAMHPCSAIIDSSSTKGRHPVPKAPGLSSPVTSNAVQKPRMIKTPSSPMQHRAQPPKQSQKRTPAVATSPSPTRGKQSLLSVRVSGSADKPAKPDPCQKTFRGPKIVIPKPNSSPTQKSKPITETVPYKSVKPWAAPPTPPRRNVTKNVQPPKAVTDKAADEYSSPSSDSFEDGSFLLVNESEEDASSTFDELSAGVSDLSDRNFLVDYGDPSRFYFRNDWNAKMRELSDSTNVMKEKLLKYQENEEVYQGTMKIIEEVESVKMEMGELYDYFDHFEREEDTLLQQVQRQLNQANRYCRILHYRLERTEKLRVDDSRAQELEDELKLSRQVAVSLHWELQAADTKQAKLEKENTIFRHRLLAAETARDALSAQVARLQNNIDQMSLHAPSQTALGDSSDGVTSNDSSSEMKRQIQFMGERENIMIARLADLQKEKDCTKDELDQYKDQYGELATVPATGANRHTDLKLRLKLAEDQAGLLARKVIELQLENDNMVKLAAEKELMTKEVLQRNPSISDLQFLEDERESLRLALDEMEIENQKLAAELLRYKQAVHRQLHSNSVSADSPLDVGVVLRVPRSNDSVFEEEKQVSRSHKSEDRSSTHHDSISEHTAAGDRKKLRPLSLTSPLNQSQKRMSISRTLSDIAIPLSPDLKSQSVQITPTANSNTQGAKSTNVTNGSRKSFCHKCKRSKKMKMVDVGIETDAERPKTLFEKVRKSIATSTRDHANSPMRSQATSPIATNLQKLFQPVLDVATQIRERKNSTRSKATSPIMAATPTLSSFPYSPTRTVPRPHNALLDEMRKQLANVRNIAESMNTVVNVEEIDAEMERKGREIVDAEYKKMKDTSQQRKKISKLAKSLQHYIRDMEESVADESERSEIMDGAAADVAGWNLHGNAEVVPSLDASCAADTSTITLSSTSSDEAFSVKTARSFVTRLRQRSIGDLGLQASQGIVLAVIAYVLMTSLPVVAIIQICFLLLVFFVC